MTSAEVGCALRQFGVLLFGDDVGTHLVPVDFAVRLFVLIPVNAVNRRPYFEGGPIGQPFASILPKFIGGLLEFCPESEILLVELIEFVLKQSEILFKGFLFDCSEGFSEFGLLQFGCVDFFHDFFVAFFSRALSLAEVELIFAAGEIVEAGGLEGIVDCAESAEVEQVVEVIVFLLILLFEVHA